MTITGRTVQDATVNVLKDERQVVNFSVAVNDYYKPRNGEKVKATTFFNCAFWKNTKVAQYLKKGTLVEVSGRLFVKTSVQTAMPKLP